MALAQQVIHTIKMSQGRGFADESADYVLRWFIGCILANTGDICGAGRCPKAGFMHRPLCDLAWPFLCLSFRQLQRSLQSLVHYFAQALHHRVLISMPLCLRWHRGLAADLAKCRSRQRSCFEIVLAFTCPLMAVNGF